MLEDIKEISKPVTYAAGQYILMSAISKVLSTIFMCLLAAIIVFKFVVC